MSFALRKLDLSTRYRISNAIATCQLISHNIRKLYFVCIVAVERKQVSPTSLEERLRREFSLVKYSLSKCVEYSALVCSLQYDVLYAGSMTVRYVVCDMQFSVMRTEKKGKGKKK